MKIFHDASWHWMSTMMLSSRWAPRGGIGSDKIRSSARRHAELAQIVSHREYRRVAGDLEAAQEFAAEDERLRRGSCPAGGAAAAGLRTALIPH